MPDEQLAETTSKAELSRGQMEEVAVMMGYGWGVGYGWIFMLVFWVLLIATVVWVVTRLLPGSGRGQSEPGRPEESPLEVLQRRLANGEIDTDEYLRVLDALSQKTADKPASARAPQGGE